MAVLSDTDTKYAKSTWKKKGEKKKNEEKCLSSTLPHKCRWSNKTCWKNQKAPNATDRNRENINNLDMKDACNCALVDLLNQKVQSDC